jgi:hypothetical protein
MHGVRIEKLHGTRTSESTTRSFAAMYIGTIVVDHHPADEGASMNNARTDVRAKGSCLCGGVRYEVRGPLRDVIACHCSQCRRTTGHFMAATAAKRAHFTVTRDDGLRWYQSSKAARRGFCGTCGAVLFWEGQGLDYISIAAGTLDVPTGLKIVRHIYAGDKSDYYGLDDGLPQSPGDGPPVPFPPH